jgi:hypothetical protein
LLSLKKNDSCILKQKYKYGQSKPFKNSFGFTSLILNDISQKPRQYFILIPCIKTYIFYRTMRKAVDNLQLSKTTQAYALGERIGKEVLSINQNVDTLNPELKAFFISSFDWVAKEGFSITLYFMKGFDKTNPDKKNIEQIREIIIDQKNLDFKQSSSFFDSGSKNLTIEKMIEGVQNEINMKFLPLDTVAVSHGAHAWSPVNAKPYVPDYYNYFFDCFFDSFQSVRIQRTHFQKMHNYKKVFPNQDYCSISSQSKEVKKMVSPPSLPNLINIEYSSSNPPAVPRPFESPLFSEELKQRLGEHHKESYKEFVKNHFDINLINFKDLPKQS